VDFRVSITRATAQGIVARQIFDGMRLRTVGKARRRFAALLLAVAVSSSACSIVRWPATTSLGGGRAEVGVASFYGKRHRGEPTASGELYDERKMTAAHPTLPFGTQLEVTNLENRRSVVVRVNDRGPFVGNRIVDLSLAAGRALGMAEDGVARVRIRALR